MEIKQLFAIENKNIAYTICEIINLVSDNIRLLREGLRPFQMLLYSKIPYY